MKFSPVLTVYTYMYGSFYLRRNHLALLTRCWLKTQQSDQLILSQIIKYFVL